MSKEESPIPDVFSNENIKNIRIKSTNMKTHRVPFLEGIQTEESIFD